MLIHQLQKHTVFQFFLFSHSQHALGPSANHVGLSFARLLLHPSVWGPRGCAYVLSVASGTTCICAVPVVSRGLALETQTRLWVEQLAWGNLRQYFLTLCNHSGSILSGLDTWGEVQIHFPWQAQIFKGAVLLVLLRIARGLPHKECCMNFPASLPQHFWSQLAPN